jgi:hypothetical protein
MIKKYKDYLKENNDYSDIDPYGEEIWDDEELNPILFIAKKQGKPYEQISYFDCSNNNLDSLEGIEKLIHLKILFCNNNNLTHLNEIENLIDLEFLDCRSNDLTNLNGMKNLIHLQRLYCRVNKFSNEYKEYLIDYCKRKKIYLSI